MLPRTSLLLSLGVPSALLAGSAVAATHTSTSSLGNSSASGAAAAPAPRGGETATPAGLVFGDVDGDGLDDAFLVGVEGQARLLMNFGEGRFEDVTLAANLAYLGGASCALFADLDGDGRLDLFTGSSETRLWKNLGNATFEPMVSGIEHDLVDLAAEALDHDQDGRLDLQIHTEAGDLVYRNLGEGRFERVELPLGTLEQVPPRHVGWVAPDSVNAADPLAAPEAGTPAQRRLGRWVQGRAVGGFAGTTTSAPSGTSSIGPSLPFLATCLPGVRDASGGACIGASSVAELGKLYPLSTDLFVAVSGEVGIGTTSPGARLDVAGTARVTDTLTLAPSGDVALDVSTGSIYKGGALFIHTKGGTFNTALGRNALASNTTGYRNTACGDRALVFNTTGFRNTASGAFALYSNTTGSRNTGLGLSALRSNTTGANNTASGADALRSNTTGANNTASGAYALLFNTTGSRNTASGTGALLRNTTGTNNTASGNEALFSNTTGYQNTASGVGALYSNTRGRQNTACGVDALRSSTTGDQNTANGLYALCRNTEGNDNTANGAYALYGNTTGERNTASGKGALYFNTTGSRNTASGTGALYGNTTGPPCQRG